MELGQNVRNIKMQIIANYEETRPRPSHAQASVFVHLNELFCMRTKPSCFPAFMISTTYPVSSKIRLKPDQKVNWEWHHSLLVWRQGIMGLSADISHRDFTPDQSHLGLSSWKSRKKISNSCDHWMLIVCIRKWVSELFLVFYCFKFNNRCDFFFINFSNFPSWHRGWNDFEVRFIML